MSIVPTPVVTLATGNTVQTATENDPAGVEHKGRVALTARATGSGTWSITFSYTAYMAPGVNDSSDVKTLTVTDATADGVLTASHETAAKNYRGWVSAASGTVDASASLTVEG